MYTYTRLTVHLQEIELEDMQIAVCCMECFLATKVATLDPNFISRLDIIA